MRTGNLLAAAILCAGLFWLVSSWYGRWSDAWLTRVQKPIPVLYTATFGCAFWGLLLGTFVFSALAVVKVMFG